jgi:hypothetical protein
MLGSMTLLAFEFKGLRISTPGIITLALLIRVLFLGYPPSDDFARYAWEGNIQLKGFNPYTHAPNHPNLRESRDSLWTKINHKEYTAIYPPLFQTIQKKLAHFYPQAIPWQMLLLFSDILALFLLYEILKSTGKSLSFLGLYAFNPFSLIFFNGEAHLDGLLVALGAFCLWAYNRNYGRLMWLGIGLAAQIKYFPLLWGVALIHKSNWKKAWWALFPLLFWLPYLDSGISPILQSLFAFNSNFHFNNPFHSFAASLFPYSNYLYISIVFLLLGLHLLIEPDRKKKSTHPQPSLAFVLTYLPPMVFGSSNAFLGSLFSMVNLGIVALYVYWPVAPIHHQPSHWCLARNSFC